MVFGRNFLRKHCSHNPLRDASPSLNKSWRETGYDARKHRTTKIDSQITSMHSSRMRTARLLTVSRIIRVGGGCLPTEGGGSARGVSARRVCIPACIGADIPTLPSPVDRMTDRCKNITLPKTSFAGGKNRVQYIIVQKTCYLVPSVSYCSSFLFFFVITNIFLLCLNLTFWNYRKLWDLLLKGTKHAWQQNLVWQQQFKYQQI